MGQWQQRALPGMLLLSSALVAAAPASAFSLFGIRLWGEEPEETVEIIDPLPYAVEVSVAGDDEEILEAVQAASALWSDRDEPASGKAGLVAKARGDYRRILGALYNLGYYGPLISVELAGQEASNVTLAVQLPPEEVPVEVTVAPGERFRFGVAELVNAPPWDDEEGAFVGETPAELGFATGEPALAVAVAAAGELAVERWRELSYAKAAEGEREIIADHATNELDATLVIEPGRPARYGTLAVEGSERIDEDFIAYMADLEPGSRFDPDEIEEAQARLIRLGVFSLVNVEEGEEIGPDNRLPMLVRVEDRLPRSFGVGATLSTLEGLGLEGFWLHRNLFGRAERLRFDAAVSRIGAKGAGELTYQLGVTFTKPGVINPDTSFFSSLVARQEDLETYFERAVTLSFGLSREFGTDFTGSLAFEVTRSQVEDDVFGTRDFLILGPVARGAWDRRDDAVDPTEGFYLAAQAGPFYETEFGNVAARGTLEGRVYAALDEEDRFVLAGRAQLGSYVGPDAAESPPGRLFFAGGGGSIRGYAYRSIGVETSFGDDVVGGRSLVETSGEIRARVSERFGVVGFLDGGYVAETSTFGGDYDWRFGAGLGVRYYTGFGPLRVDLATPLDPRDEDSTVALYIGIGQAF